MKKIKVYLNELENRIVSTNDFEEMVAKQVKEHTEVKVNFDLWLDAHYTASQVLAMDDESLESLFERFEADTEADVRNELAFEWSCHLVGNC